MGSMTDFYPQGLKVKQVQVIHRHGERTPVKSTFSKYFQFDWNLCFNVDKHTHSLLAHSESNSNEHSAEHPSHESKPINFKVKWEHSNERPKELLGACYFGQLTDIGRKNLMSFGRRLNELYVRKLGFLPEKCDPSLMYLRSTNYARTFESVQSLFLGMYPNCHENVVLNARQEYDETLHASRSCEAYRTTMKDFRSKQAKVNRTKVPSNLEFLFEESNESPTVHKVFDILASAQGNEYPLPLGVQDKDVADLGKLVAEEWYGAYKYDHIKRLGIGRFVGEMSDRIKNHKNERERFFVYSGHDVTIGPLLQAFGVYDGLWPKFGANIIFEVVQKDNKDFVRMKYNEEFQQIPQCPQSEIKACPIETFMKICEKLIPKDYEAECNRVHNE